MRKVEAALLWEEELIKEFDLGRAVGEETLVVGVQELVQRYGEGVVGRSEGGCAWLLQQKKHEELGLMYRLFKREALTVAAAQTAAAAAAAAAAKEAARTAAATAAALAAAAAAGGRGGGEGGGGNNPPSTPPYPAFPSVSALPPVPPPPPLPLPHGSRSTTELASLSALSLSSPPSLPASFSSSSSSEHPLLDKMGVILEKHIISLGEALQEDRNLRLAKERKLEAYDPIYIAELLKIHSEYVELTTSVLGAHSVFKSRLHAAFVVILNNNGRVGGKGPEEKPRLITTACDRLLRVGGASEEAKVNEILGLVVYLKDKDYFESCYRTEMMRRLLANRYVCSPPPSLPFSLHPSGTASIPFSSHPSLPPSLPPPLKVRRGRGEISPCQAPTRARGPLRPALPTHAQ